MSVLTLISGLLLNLFHLITFPIQYIVWPITKPLWQPIWDYIVRKCYVEQILFNTAWEDPRVDEQVLNISEDDSALIITSAGCNALAIALQNPKHVYSVDRNPCQNALFELKIAGIRELSYENFFKLFGEGWLPEFSRKYYPLLRQHLSPESRSFWDARTYYFDGGWIHRSFYMRGCSGVLALGMRVMVKLLGVEKPILELFDAASLEEQEEIYRTRIEKRLFNPILMAILKQPLTLSLLNGVPASQTELLAADSRDNNIANFIKDSMEWVMIRQPMRENYFYRVYLTGKYTKDCCPAYLTEDGFTKLQKGLVDKVSIHTMTITEFLESQPDLEISRFVLLDHMDWLVNMPEVLTDEWEQILRHSPENARYLWRSAAKSADFVLETELEFRERATTLNALLDVDSALGDELTKQDRVHTYTSFHIADLRS